MPPSSNELGLADVKMVLITNASMFHRPHVQRGLEVLDRNNGEIWAKLDAGTDEYFHLIDRTPIPFRQILDNITAAARVRPLVIQSLFMRVNGEPPTPAELDAFCDRLNEIVAAGGQLKLVQIYTIARRPAESYVAPLADGEVDAIVELVRSALGSIRGYTMVARTSRGVARQELPATGVVDRKHIQATPFAEPQGRATPRSPHSIARCFRGANPWSFCSVKSPPSSTPFCITV